MRNWSMRFEAKHHYFKRLADKSNNFKNITYSLAKRHQALQAYLRQSSAGSVLRMSLKVGPDTEYLINESLICYTEKKKVLEYQHRSITLHYWL